MSLARTGISSVLGVIFGILCTVLFYEMIKSDDLESLLCGGDSFTTQFSVQSTGNEKSEINNAIDILNNLPAQDGLVADKKLMNMGCVEVACALSCMTNGNEKTLSECEQECHNNECEELKQDIAESTAMKTLVKPTVENGSSLKQVRAVDSSKSEKSLSVAQKHLSKFTIPYSNDKFTKDCVGWNSFKYCTDRGNSAETCFSLPSSQCEQAVKNSESKDLAEMILKQEEALKDAIKKSQVEKSGVRTSVSGSKSSDGVRDMRGK